MREPVHLAGRGSGQRRETRRERGRVPTLADPRVFHVDSVLASAKIRQGIVRDFDLPLYAHVSAYNGQQTL